jgi:hypothetical protein
VTDKRPGKRGAADSSNEESLAKWQAHDRNSIFRDPQEFYLRPRISASLSPPSSPKAVNCSTRGVTPTHW